MLIASCLFLYRNQLELEVEIDCSELADLLWDNTPIEGVANLWGDEIYFETSLYSQSNSMQEVVEIGDLAFWPPGQAICLFFGSTPMSTGDEIRPASPVNVFGKFIDNPKLLKTVKTGDSISIYNG